jgi:transcription-repair coupling factor (superfamily II helicase)
MQDMISPQPMDRLVCGDVGFGKTEVALRAAFVAAMGGKQVAFLAPTTLLAEQHYQTLVDRFANWPVKVAEVSRFRSGKEITAAIKGIPTARSTSWSARTSCCPSPSSRTWACSSSTRNTASACATRRP